MADSSPWKGRSTGTNPAEPACPRRSCSAREAPARPRPPPRPARSPRTKFVSAEGPEPPRAFWKGSGTEENAGAVRARGVHGARRLGCPSGGHRGGVGGAQLFLASASPEIALPDCRGGPRAPARHVPAAAAAAEPDRAQPEAGPGRRRRAPPAVLVWLRAGAAGDRVPRRLPRRPPGAGHPPQGAHGGAEHGAGRARLHLQPALHREELPAQGAAPLRVHCHRPR